MSLSHFFDRIVANGLNPEERAVRVTAFGDSMTQGVMAHRFLDCASTYHRLLQLELEAFYPSTTFQVLNAGVAGDTASKSLARLDRDVLSHQPDLVLICFGPNDALRGLGALTNFEKALTQMILRIRNESSADILLLTAAFMASRLGAQIHPEHAYLAEEIIRCQNEGILAAYCERIREVAVKTGVELADVAREWQRLKESGLDTDLWLINGLNHPDARGHRLASVVVFHALLSARP